MIEIDSLDWDITPDFRAFEIAIARVDAEDEALRRRRIAAYAREIQVALNHITVAKNAGHTSVRLALPSGDSERAQRIKESLTSLHYKCSEVPNDEHEDMGNVKRFPALEIWISWA